MNKTIVAAHKNNFEMLQRAFVNGDVALIECYDPRIKEKIAVIVVTVKEEDGSVQCIPFATFFNGNPYEMIYPPCTDGGFEKPDGTVFMP